MLADRADDCFPPGFDIERQNWVWLYFHTKDPRPGETPSMRHSRVAQFCLANAELSRFNDTPFDARRRMEQNKLWLLTTTTPAGIPRFDKTNEPGRVEEISDDEGDTMDAFQRVFGVTYDDACADREKYRNPMQHMSRQERVDFYVESRSNYCRPSNTSTILGKIEFVVRKILSSLICVVLYPFMTKRDRIYLARKIDRGYQFETIVRIKIWTRIFLFGEPLEEYKEINQQRTQCGNSKRPPEPIQQTA